MSDIIDRLRNFNQLITFHDQQIAAEEIAELRMLIDALEEEHELVKDQLEDQVFRRFIHGFTQAIAYMKGYRDGKGVMRGRRKLDPST